MLARLRAYLLAGIVVTTPLAITLWLTWNFIHWVDVQITPLIPVAYNPGTYLPFSVPGLGLLIMLVFLTLVGFVAANFFGRAIIHLAESARWVKTLGSYARWHEAAMKSPAEPPVDVSTG